MKPVPLLLPALLSAVLLVACGRSADDSDGRVETELFGEMVMRQFPHSPGIVQISYHRGRGEVIFMKEDTACFESAANIERRWEVAKMEAFGAIPELQTLRIIVPFKGEIWARSSSRDFPESSHAGAAADTVTVGRGEL